MPSVIPRLKAHIRRLTMADCADAARQALAQSSAEAVRTLALRLAARKSEPESV